MRMWRNWQTRRFQVPVGDHAGSSPVIRTKICKDLQKYLQILVFCFIICIIIKPNLS